MIEDACIICLINPTSFQEALAKLPIFAYHYNRTILLPIVFENLLQSWPLHLAPFLVHQPHSIIQTIILQKPSQKWTTNRQETGHCNLMNLSFALCDLWLKKYLTCIFFSNENDALWHTVTCLDPVIIVQLDCANKIDWPKL
jgi:hypothetical protein